jgi:hypothetical protein
VHAVGIDLARAIPTSSLITRRVAVPRVMGAACGRPRRSRRAPRASSDLQPHTPHATAASAQRAYPVTGSVNTRYKPCIIDFGV